MKTLFVFFIAAAKAAVGKQWYNCTRNHYILHYHTPTFKKKKNVSLKNTLEEAVNLILLLNPET